MVNYSWFLYTDIEVQTTIAVAAQTMVVLVMQTTTMDVTQIMIVDVLQIMVAVAIRQLHVRIVTLYSIQAIAIGVMRRLRITVAVVRLTAAADERKTGHRKVACFIGCVLFYFFLPPFRKISRYSLGVLPTFFLNSFVK
jgi:hypothetical protein